MDVRSVDEGSEAEAADEIEIRMGARATGGAHAQSRPAVAAAARAAPRPWQAMTEPPTVTLPDRSSSKAEGLDPTALQPRRPKAAPTVPEVSCASSTEGGRSAPAPRKAASARPSHTTGGADTANQHQRDGWLAAQGGSGASQARPGDGGKASKASSREDEVTRQVCVIIRIERIALGVVPRDGAAVAAHLGPNRHPSSDPYVSCSLTDDAEILQHDQ